MMQARRQVSLAARAADAGGQPATWGAREGGGEGRSAHAQERMYLRWTEQNYLPLVYSRMGLKALCKKIRVHIF